MTLTGLILILNTTMVLLNTTVLILITSHIAKEISNRR